MNEPLHLRRLSGVIQMTLKSVLTATIILCVVYPTTTVLSLARTSSAKASLPSYKSHHGYHKDDKGVDTGMPKLEDMLGTQAKMLVELIPRDTESNMFKYLPSSKDGHEIVERLPDSRFSISEGTAIIDESATAISELTARHIPPAWRPRPPPLNQPPRSVASKDNLSEPQIKSDARIESFAEAEISTRNAQASRGGWGRQKPKPKKNPPPGTSATTTTDTHPRKIPCNRPSHRCPPLGSAEDDLPDAVLEPRQWHTSPFQNPRPKKKPPPGTSSMTTRDILPRKIPCRGYPPLGAAEDDLPAAVLEPRQWHTSPILKPRPPVRPPHTSRDESIKWGSNSRPEKLYRTCDRSGCRMRSSRRDGDAGGAGIQQDKSSVIANVHRLNIGKGNVTDAKLDSNGTTGKNETGNGTGNDEGKAAITILYIVAVVVGFCMLLLFIITTRHACIQRRRRNAIAFRKTAYPSLSGFVQQLDGSQAECSTRKKSQGSTRMNRIDEEVAEEPQIVQSDGASDGWTKWLLQKRETRKTVPMSPMSQNPSYRIPTLKLPQPTFATVRKFSGLPSEASVGDNPKGKGRGFSKAKWTSTV